METKTPESVLAACDVSGSAVIHEARETIYGRDIRRNSEILRVYRTHVECPTDEQLRSKDGPVDLICHELLAPRRYIASIEDALYGYEKLRKGFREVHGFLNNKMAEAHRNKEMSDFWEIAEVLANLMDAMYPSRVVTVKDPDQEKKTDE